MNNRRKNNENAMRPFGALVLPKQYVPSKADLFKLLDALRHKEPPEVSDVRSVFNEAVKARQTFERNSKIWRRLRRAEKIAQRELQRIQSSGQERLKDEIADCRTMLRLHGVTPELTARIERLAYGEE